MVGRTWQSFNSQWQEYELAAYQHGMGWESRYPNSKERPAHWPSKSTPVSWNCWLHSSIKEASQPAPNRPKPSYGSQVFKSASLQESSQIHTMSLRKTMGRKNQVELCSILCLPQRVLLLSAEVLMSISYLWDHSLSIPVLLACLGNRSFWAVSSASYFTLGDPNCSVQIVWKKHPDCFPISEVQRMLRMNNLSLGQ